MKKNKKEIEILALKLTHSSCAIENNTFTYQQTKELLSQKQINFNEYSTKKLREVYELLNFKKVILYILDNYNNLKIDNETIKLIHSIIMNNIIENKGLFRRHNVAISGSYVRPCDYSVVEYKLQNLNAKFKNKIKTTTEKLENILEYHCNFEKIHPFSDGNGRTGRAILFLMQLQHNLDILYIDPDYKQEYYQALSEYDIRGDIKPLKRLVLKTKGNICLKDKIL
ncbi:Fic family protein [Mycoplasma sp. 4013]